MRARVVPLRFNFKESYRASDEWNFNCGPAALCGAFNLTPDEVRPHLGNFEQKGYTNPSLMFEALRNLDLASQTRAPYLLAKSVKWRTIYRSDDPAGVIPKVELGLVRIQWGGPWTNPRVPMRVRYRQTHWVAVADDSTHVFDINAIKDAGGWLPYSIWAEQLIPWLISECVPKGDGRWWPTHVIEILK